MRKTKQGTASEDNISSFPPLSRETHQSIFDHAGNGIVHWMMYAEALLDSAAAVRKTLIVFKRRLFRRRPGPESAYYDSQADVFLLLQGLAIECLLKAKWVSDDGVLAQNGKYVGIKGAGDHNLRQIVHQCQRQFRDKQHRWRDRKTPRFASDSQYEHIYSDKRQLVFSDRQLFLLDQLSQYIMWAGRYPIPKKVEIFSPQNKNAKLLRAVSARDFQEIDRIIKIIKRTMTSVEWKQLANGDWVGEFPED
jgi:hypothetical protein